MPATIAELPATPQEIYEDRSLYKPAEPNNPELAERVWRSLERSGNDRPWNAFNAIGGAALGLTEVVGTFGVAGASLDLEEISSVLTLDCLEWYIHENAQALKQRYLRGINFSHPTPISGLIGGMIDFQAIDPSLDRRPYKVPLTAGVLVIPEILEGRISNLFSKIDGSNAELSYVIIGDVGNYFAESIRQGQSLTLFGSAGDYAFTRAGGPVLRDNRTRPSVVIHGNVGDNAAESATSLSLTIKGDAGDCLGNWAGYVPTRFNTELKTSVLIRVDGHVGRLAAHHATGAFELSCGSLESLGDPIDLEGGVHVGPCPPFSEGHKTNPGKFLVNKKVRV